MSSSKPRNAKSKKQSCTCGHHYGSDGHDVSLSLESQNSPIAAASTSNSSAFAVGSCGEGNRIIPQDHPHRHPSPLDASFVQVSQHDYSTDRTAAVLQPLTHPEELQKHCALEDVTSTIRNFGKAEPYRRLMRLQEAAASALNQTSLTPPPPPPLCLSCIQRYGILDCTQTTLSLTYILPYTHSTSHQFPLLYSTILYFHKSTGWNRPWIRRLVACMPNVKRIAKQSKTIKPASRRGSDS